MQPCTPCTLLLLPRRRSQISSLLLTSIEPSTKMEDARTRKPRKQSSQDGLPAPASLEEEETATSPVPPDARCLPQLLAGARGRSSRQLRPLLRATIKPHYHITPHDPARPPKKSRTPRTESPPTAPLSVKTAPAPDTTAARRRRAPMIKHSRRSPDTASGAAGGIS